MRSRRALSAPKSAPNERAFCIVDQPADQQPLIGTVSYALLRYVEVCTLGVCNGITASPTSNNTPIKWYL